MKEIKNIKSHTDRHTDRHTGPQQYRQTNRTTDSYRETMFTRILSDCIVHK